MKRIFAIGFVLMTAAAITTSAKDKKDMLRGVNPPKNMIWVDGLMDETDGSGLKAGRSRFGTPLALGGGVFQHGIGAYPAGALVLKLEGNAELFAAVVGVDGASTGKSGQVLFEVWLDGVLKSASSPLGAMDGAEFMEVSLDGAQTLALLIKGENGELAADWGGAVIKMKEGANPPTIAKVDNSEMIEIAHTDMMEVGIHGPRIVGTTPGLPFVFKIPATGDRPVFSAERLPDGLALDPSTGVIMGSLKKEGTYEALVKIKANNGEAERILTIIGGNHKLALTPPMGWNSWNVWGTSVDDRKVRAAADAMMKSGLANFGFSYVNIDDAWEGVRDESGVLNTNEKFPDMRALADYVHAYGLKLGIYSSPGPKTCGGYPGSYQYEYMDAATWASWGIDYLKHDWCDYRYVAEDNSRAELMKPYQLMRKAIDESGRDIVYSLCQYGMGNVWEWGADETIAANLWRTTGDIVDTWESMSAIGFNQNGLEKFSGPGNWNDPDMLVVGKVGWGPRIHPTRLTRNEQVTHITLWSILSAPLLIGCDMTDLDEFTFDLLTNTEVLDVDQDPLGRQGRRIAEPGLLVEVWAKPLFDGTVAVGLFNRNVDKAEITVKWDEIGLTGEQPVRDLWKKTDAGEFADEYTTVVPAHGAALIKVGRPN